MIGEPDGVAVAPAAAPPTDPPGPLGNSRSPATVTATSTTAIPTIGQKAMSRRPVGSLGCGVAAGRWAMLSPAGSPP